MREICQCVSNHNKNVTATQTIDAIKNAGFKSVFVQWYDHDVEPSEQEQLDYCRKLGLKIEFAHLGYDGLNEIWVEGEAGENLVKKYIKNLEDCAKNKINLVIMHLQSKSVAPGPNEIGLERLQKVVDYAEKLNIKIAFENTKIFGYLEYIFDHIKNQNIGICFDIGHCHAFFNDKFSFDKFSGRIFAVHLHDNDRSDDLHLLPFDGDIDWNYFIDELKNANYNGPVTLESCYKRQYLEESLEDFYKESYKRGEKLRDIFGD